MKNVKIDLFVKNDNDKQYHYLCSTNFYSLVRDAVKSIKLSLNKYPQDLNAYNKKIGFEINQKNIIGRKA